MSTRTRRHGRELEAAITDAVMAELAERGYSGVTYERVAARAGTSKPVLYRRWASRAELVLAAVIASSTAVVEAPDLGSLGADLKALLVSIDRNFSNTGRATMLGLMAELDDVAAQSVRTRIFGWGAELAAPLVDRARARGELGAGHVPVAAVALPLDLGRYELAMRGSLPAERIDSIVDTITVPLLRLHAGDTGS